MWEVIQQWLGIGHPASSDLETRHMVFRAVIVFIFAVVIARLGSTRFMARNSAFDLILAIMLGSVLSRAITGQSPFLPTLAAGAVLVTMHGLLAWIAARMPVVGYLIKGRGKLIVKDGREIQKALRRNSVGHHDLSEALRLNGVSSMEDVKEAYLERNGDISIVKK
jgi:uncharacterized membrane protein YcaP (DUF421 family)